MKLKSHLCSGEHANVLMVTLVIAGIIGLVLASYLTLVRSQYTSVVRSQSWNASVALMEAGVEEAMTHLNQNGITNLHSNGWTLSGTRYRIERTLGAGYYEVFIDPNDNKPIIESEASVPLLTSRNPGDSIGFAALGGIESRHMQYVRRKVRVNTQSDSLFSKAMVADGKINLNGNNITTDSFDSADPEYSTSDGLYDPTKRKANGDVATNFDVVDESGINVGNADIFGRVSTGAGARVNLGPNGKVGDAAWHAGSGNMGIQPGWISDDMNVDFPVVEPPFGTALPPTGDTVDGVTYNYILSSGNWMISSGSFGGKVLVTGDATLYVKESAGVSFTGQDQITITTNASLNLYVGSSTANIGGNGVLNESGNAINFFYHGLPGNTSLSLNGNGEFTGVIYAPNAAFNLNGGGRDETDFIGASITKTVTMNGKFQFHYDENLARIGPGRGYVVTLWEEI
jgi:hypothetical protein